MRKFIYITVIVSLLTLSACGGRKTVTRLVSVDREHPSPNQIFAQELSLKYKDLADSQRRYRDWADHDHFSKKAARSAEGIMVDPEHPGDWEVRLGEMEILKDARMELLNTITKEVITSDPKASARAYVLYDCWLDQEEDWLEDSHLSCRNEFFEVLNYLSLLKEGPQIKELHNEAHYLKMQMESGSLPSIAMEPKEPLHTEKKTEELTVNSEIATVEAAVKLPELPELPGKETDINNEKEEIVEKIELKPALKIEAKTEPMLVKKPVDNFSEQNNYGLMFDTSVVFFEFNKANVTDQSREVLSDMYKNIESSENSLFIINGHADRHGTEAFNMELSTNRAQAIAEELINLGVSRQLIQTYAFGESRPVVETKDGIKHAANRRVEIFIE